MIRFFEKYFDIAIFPGTMTALGITLITFGHWVSSIEFTAVLLSLIGLAMTKKQIAFGQLVTFVSQILLIYYFYSNNLMSGVAFAATWAVINLVTYVNWTYPHGKTSDKQLRPSFMDNRYLLLILTGSLAIIALRWEHGLIGAIEYLSPFCGLIGHLLLINKRVQGWLFFVIAISVMTVLMATIGSYLLFARNIMFVIIGVIAFIKWGKEARKQ